MALVWNENGPQAWSAESPEGTSLTIVEDAELGGLYRVLGVDVTGECEFESVLPTIEFAKEVAEQWAAAVPRAEGT